MRVIDLTLLDKVSSEAKESPRLRRDARRKIVRLDRQTRRPSLAGGWCGRGAKGSVARKRRWAGSGDDA